MLSRILSSTKGKPCSCPNHKHCTGCRSKALKPRVHLEDPHRLTIPIVISHYKHRRPTSVNRSTEKQWPIGKEPHKDKTPARPTALCAWIRKRRALRQLKAEKKREKERERDILRREREIEFIEQIQRQQRYEELEPVIIPPKKQPRPKRAPKPKPLKALPLPKPLPPPKPVRAKTQYKSTFAKPNAESKVVSVQRYYQHQPISVRFVNCCYRFCCQLYCCLTIMFLIGLAIILLI